MPATRHFTDISLGFSPHPDTHDLALVHDDNAIVQSLRNLILTRNYERPFHSEIGSQVNALLFEPASPMTVIRLQKSIENVINNFEPRVSLLGVAVADQSVNNAYAVSIHYVIVNTSIRRSLELTLERSR